jgi:hypothetical protein
MGSPSLDIEKKASTEYVDDVALKRKHSMGTNDADFLEGLEVKMPESLMSLTPEELDAAGKKATRKIDLVLMPTLIFLYLLNFLDRNNISTAKIGGITHTLNMPHAQQFSTAVAILFAGYSELKVGFLEGGYLIALLSVDSSVLSDRRMR